MGVFELFKEANWLKKLNKRDHEAFSQCYDFYAPKLYRHAFYRLGSKELAEDLVSEVFIKVWEFLADPAKKIENLRAFLYRIANNLIIDRYRGKDRQPILINEELENILGDEGEWEKDLGKRVEFEEVLRSLEKMPEATREILTWRYIDELGIGEIAELSGRTKNAVYVALHRALREMRALLKKDYENL
jgi:RNA polymerase sigma-70 factor (ECF subfamily)